MVRALDLLVPLFASKCAGVTNEVQSDAENDFFPGGWYSGYSTR